MIKTELVFNMGSGFLAPEPEAGFHRFDAQRLDPIVPSWEA